MHIVENYLALEQIRFEERLKVDIHIPQDNLQLPVPPMMLQALVENAIKHGISKKLNGGTISIRSSIRDNEHELIVTNTGHLNGHFNEHGFGIPGTRNRLKLLYDDKATLPLKNIDEDMVEAKITLPVTHH